MRPRVIPLLRAAGTALRILWPVAVIYLAFSLTGPQPLRRTLMLLLVIVVAPFVLIGPVAIVRRRRLQALNRRWQAVWRAADRLTVDRPSGTAEATARE